MTRTRLAILVAVLGLAVTGTLAQRYYDRIDRRDVPDWEVDPEFSRDVFTFRTNSALATADAEAGEAIEATSMVGVEAAGPPTFPTAI